MGFALLDVVDGGPHLEEMAVIPEHGRRGLGERLIEVVCEHARPGRPRGLTLTTFRDLPWNGPFYRRMGFAPVPRTRSGPELAKLRLEEIERGLDVAPREILRRSLAAGG